LCALKVIDSTLYNEKGTQISKKIDYASVVVVGERIEDMPVVRRIGDILRIQKATVKVNEGEKKYIVDERSNWCLFR
jgi:histidinol phosphatase-like enzyme